MTMESKSFLPLALPFGVAGFAFLAGVSTCTTGLLRAPPDLVRLPGVVPSMLIPIDFNSCSLSSCALSTKLLRLDGVRLGVCGRETFGVIWDFVEVLEVFVMIWEKNL